VDVCATINAAEDKLRMGPDRTAAAMLVAASDERGQAGGDDADVMAARFTEYVATEIFSTDDPAESEAFVAARRFAIPAVEEKGPLLLEDVGVPMPALADLVSGIARIADRHDLMIAVIAHAGDGNTHPLIVYDAADAAVLERANLAYGEVIETRAGAWRDHHRRARRGPTETSVAGRPPGARRDGVEPAHQVCP
jgi:glycolate oxidase